MFGINSWHIRMLTNNPWIGGCGYSYEQVACMTPDQIWHRICDEKVLKRKGGHRVGTAKPAGVIAKSGDLVKGRAADGTPIEGRVGVGGKSLARRLMEQAEAEKSQENRREGRRERRRRRRENRG